MKDIGTDFLRAYHMIIDFEVNSVICDGNPVIARCQEGSDPARRVFVAEAVVGLAGTWMITEGKTVKPVATGSWVLDPLRGKKLEDKSNKARELGFQ